MSEWDPQRGLRPPAFPSQPSTAVKVQGGKKPGGWLGRSYLDSSCSEPGALRDQALFSSQALGTLLGRVPWLPGRKPCFWGSRRGLSRLGADQGAGSPQHAPPHTSGRPKLSWELPPPPRTSRLNSGTARSHVEKGEVIMPQFRDG